MQKINRHYIGLNKLWYCHHPTHVTVVFFMWTPEAQREACSVFDMCFPQSIYALLFLQVYKQLIIYNRCESTSPIKL